jgi:hypothetical protein
MRTVIGLSALMGLAASGCTTLSTLQSTETVDLSPQAAATVADDLARMAAQRHGPGPTPLAMPHPDRPLGQALERALRRTGYAVNTGDTAPGVRVAYAVDGFGQDQVLVRLTVGPDYQVARLYSMRGDRAVPVSPYTVNRGAASP